ncbi:MAG TPA: hypothetical protein VK194_02940, partial [Candidatus Deferrimicrobium sp.]|nr:hypothetical protein [Candidatus Deferrimicrobium sp.]
AIHVSLPATGLGIPASALLQLGVNGDAIDFDMVYAGDAMYARSPVFKPMLSLILGPSGKVPTGDLTGWLKLGTKEELAAFAALSGGASATPSAPGSSVTAQSLRTALDAAGITLTSATTEKHDGTDANHVKVVIDAAKLATNPTFAAGAGAQYAQVAAALRATTLSGDLWIAPTTNRLLEIDLHVASTADASQAGDVTVLLDDPDGSVSLDAPPATVDVPITTLFRELMKLIGNGAES